MTPFEIGLICSLGLLLLLMCSMPVGLAMIFAGFIGFSWIVNVDAASHMIIIELYDTFSSYNLTVIPLFILMGQIAYHSGISKRLFHAAYAWLGPLPGGLAMATVGACTAFGAICGSGPATAATMAAVALPEMRKYGYDVKLASGTVAAGGSLGMLIPPSVVFIVYAIITEQSVGELFIAGIVPGLLIAALFCLTILFICLKNPEQGPRCKSPGIRVRLLSLLGISETLALFLLVIGGMFAGLFTPTEAAAVGSAGSILIAAARGNLSLKMLHISLMETLRTSCMVMTIVAGAVIFGRFLAITQIPTALATSLATLPVPGWVIIAIIISFFLFAGCFVDALALVLLTVPIFAPVITGLGFDLIWFGVIIVVVTQMGVITPPVGVCAYVVCGVARDIPLQTVFRGSIPFLIALIISSILLVAFPPISLFLAQILR